MADSPRGRSPPSPYPREFSRSPPPRERSPYPRALSRSPPPRERSSYSRAFSPSPPPRKRSPYPRGPSRSPSPRERSPYSKALSRSPPLRERSPPPRELSRSRSISRSRSRSPPRSRPKEWSRSRSRSRGRPDTLNPGNTLYVTGLSTRVREEDLEAHFSKEGKVASCRLVMEPRTRISRGFAFITMDTLENADRCVKYLNQSVLEGRYITVEKSRRKRPRTPTPGHYLGLKSTRDVAYRVDRQFRGRQRGGGHGREDYGYRGRSPRRSPNRGRSPYRGSRDYSPRRSPYGGRSRRYRSRSRSYSPYASSPVRSYGRR